MAKPKSRTKSGELNDLQIMLEAGKSVTGLKGYIQSEHYPGKERNNSQTIYIKVTAQGLAVEDDKILVLCKVDSSGDELKIRPSEWLNDFNQVKELRASKARIEAAITDGKNLINYHYNKVKATKLADYIATHLPEKEVADFMEHIKDTTSKTALTQLTVDQLRDAICTAVCIVHKVTPEERQTRGFLRGDRYY